MTKLLSPQRRCRWLCALIVAFAFVGGIPGLTPAVSADTIVVANGNDSGTGSLRAAITQANFDGDVDVITFDPGVTTVTLTTDTLVISSPLTIDGGSGGVTIARSAAVGTPDFGIVNISGSPTVTLIGLTITNGRDDFAAGISASGTLTLRRCVVVNNVATASGGGVTLSGTTAIASNLAVIDSTISGNTATQSGGGIYNFGFGGGATVTISGSTVSGNTAADGGGIFNSAVALSANAIGSAQLSVTNSTISGNQARLNGGGIMNVASGTGAVASLSLEFATLMDNLADSDNNGTGLGHHLNARGGNGAVSTMTIGRALFSHSNIGLVPYIVTATQGNGTSTVTSNGHNISRKDLAGAVASDRTNTDPLLGALAVNGGPTKTHHLGSGSPAINLVPVASCTTATGVDQRGGTRPAGAACDAGAYESGASASGTPLPEPEPTPGCQTGFADVPNDHPACTAIAALVSKGVISGYATNPPRFGVDDPVQRAQMAAFLVRALEWQGDATTPRSFTDFGQLVAELQTASLILANKCDAQGNCVAKGYAPADCAAKGKTAPCFGPNDSVTRAQVISFITRAFIQDPTYAWLPQPGLTITFGEVPEVHRADIQTYSYYVGSIPDVPTTIAEWSEPAPREWVARALYLALQAPAPPGASPAGSPVP